MAKTHKYGLRELKQEFKDEDICLEHLFDVSHVRTCSCGGIYRRLKARKQFQCSKCRYQIAPMSGTIFSHSTTPLTLWFHAILVFSNAKSGISAKQMERELNVTYKTAWRMLSLIRGSLTQSKEKLDGIVEADESFFGGKGHSGTGQKAHGEVMEKKIKVIVAIKRKGETRAVVIPDNTAKTIRKFIKKTIVPGSTLVTDMSRSYPKEAFKRLTVNHTKKEWVNGEAYINSVESFNGHVKRSIKGVYKSVSRQHFQSYLDEFVWLRNNRHNDRKRFGVLMKVLTTSSKL